jgi:glycosyltransferase involved in cell wall biosynthesis
LKKLKIIVLIDWYLPGTRAGGPVRSVHSLMELLKNEFDFYLITLNKDLGSSIPYPGITPNENFNKEGINYFYFDHTPLPEEIARVINHLGPDLIYANSFWSIPFSIQVVRLHKAGRLKAPLLVAPRGMLGQGALGIKPIKKRTYLLLARIADLYRTVSFHATQEQEYHDIRNIFRKAPITIAPNINSFSPYKNTSAKSRGTLRMFFLSRISEVKNLHFALQVLTEVPAEVNITYDIFGNLEDAEYWRKCSDIIATLPSNVKVRHNGELQFYNVQQEISKYHVLFLPTLNENFGHSIVESLLCGCAVIISDQTPWHNLMAKNAGYDLSLANKQAFLSAIKTLASEDQETFDKRSAAAINYISEKIDLTLILQQYKNLFYDSAKN